MRKAAIIVSKSQSERIYEVINSIVSGHEYEIEHTVFSDFDNKEICVIILSASLEVLTNVREWLRGEFSSSAVWMEVMTTGKYMLE